MRLHCLAVLGAFLMVPVGLFVGMLLEARARWMEGRP